MAELGKPSKRKTKKSLEFSNFKLFFWFFWVFSKSFGKTLEMVWFIQKCKEKNFTFVGGWYPVLYGTVLYKIVQYTVKIWSANFFSSISGWIRKFSNYKGGEEGSVKFGKFPNFLGFFPKALGKHWKWPDSSRNAKKKISLLCVGGWYPVLYNTVLYKIVQYSSKIWSENIFLQFWMN